MSIAYKKQWMTYNLTSVPRADQQKCGGCITDKVAEGLLNATGVIADVTEGNANVMYELGIAHSFRKPTVIIKNRSDPKEYQLPFDIKDQETLFYDYDPEWGASKQNVEMEKARKELRAYIQQLIAGAIEAKSPVVHALSGRAAFVDDLRDWLWGYARTYEEEKQARAVWEITADPYWVVRDPLFSRLLLDGIEHETRQYFFLVPRTELIKTDIEDLAAYVRGQLKKEEHWKVDKGLNYMQMDKEFFDLFALPIVLYDATIPNLARGYVCEPMAPAIGEERDFDEAVIIKRPIEQMSQLPPLERWREKRFDIRLDKRKLSGLRTSFAGIWNKKVEAQIEDLKSSKQVTSEERIRVLKEHWLIP